MASFEIYQMKDGPELHDFRFTSIDMLKKLNITDVDDINISMYDHKYTDDLTSYQKSVMDATLEAIYCRFNINRPEDFKGHSLSVSDVIVIHPDKGKPKAYYVDNYGFVELKCFLSKAKEKSPIVR